MPPSPSYSAVAAASDAIRGFGVGLTLPFYSPGT
jgi:hypothetical protein